MKLIKYLSVMMLSSIVLATSASAAAINWTIAGANNASNAVKDYNGNVYQTTLYFLYSPTTTFNQSVFQGFNNSADFWSKISIYTLATHTTGSDGLYTTPVPNAQTVQSASLTAGTQYGFAMLIAFETSKVVDDTIVTTGWFKYADTYATAFDPSKPEDADTAATGTVTLKNAGWNIGYQYITPIPEPATGAMALAGLALLFRRKRK